MSSATPSAGSPPPRANPLERLRAFRALPRIEQERILAEQAAAMAPYYATDPEVQEWLNAPLLSPPPTIQQSEIGVPDS